MHIMSRSLSKKSKNSGTPLNYQLEEVDSERMMLQPTPTGGSRNAANDSANFAYLS